MLYYLHEFNRTCHVCMCEFVVCGCVLKLYTIKSYFGYMHIHKAWLAIEAYIVHCVLYPKHM